MHSEQMVLEESSCLTDVKKSMKGCVKSKVRHESKVLAADLWISFVSGSDGSKFGSGKSFPSF